jgi:hypothetical protein
LIKTLLKLVLVALVANATVRVGMAYLAFYRFTDAVQQTMQFGTAKTDEQLQSRVLELASEYDIPIDAGNFTIRHDEIHTIVDGSFTEPIDLLPGRSYRWPFSWHIDTFSTQVPPPSR